MDSTVITELYALLSLGCELFTGRDKADSFFFFFPPLSSVCWFMPVCGKYIKYALSQVTGDVARRCFLQIVVSPGSDIAGLVI